MEASYEGFLQVLTEDKKKLRRYFILCGDRLYTYKKKPITDEDIRVPLVCYNVADCKCSVNHNEPLVLILSGSSIGIKAIVLITSTEEEKNLWVDKFKHLRKIKTPIFQPLGDEEDPATGKIAIESGGNEGHSMIVGKKVTTDDFEVIAIVGKGSYSTVMQVKKKDTGEIFAMKEMRKDVIERANLLEHTAAEKSILQRIAHPFIVKMYYAFQTKSNLYLVLEFLSGGELFYHLSECGTFDLYRAKFYTACIGHAIGHMHSLNIIFRDLKPENIGLDKDGYSCLTDFGLAKTNVVEASAAQTFCGTPEYLAPEFLLGSGHGKAVDWWSLGILLYEMLFGIPPFYSENVDEMYELILQKPLTFPDDIPVNEDTKDILTKLLNRNPAVRIQTVEAFMSHPFFNDINFDDLLTRKLEPPFKPDPARLNFSEEFTSLSPQLDAGDDRREGPNFAGFTYEADKDENRIALEKMMSDEK